MTVPAATENDTPFNQPATVVLQPGEQATVTFEAQQRRSVFFLPLLAVTKVPAATYEVRMDDRTVYGPCAVPPTDIDDLAQTFHPCLRFSEQMEVVISNLSESSTRTIHVQPVGFERSDGGA